MRMISIYPKDHAMKSFFFLQTYFNSWVTFEIESYIK